MAGAGRPAPAGGLEAGRLVRRSDFPKYGNQPLNAGCVEKRYPDISDTLKKGKEVAIYEVENALFRRARGFETVDVTEELRKDARGKTIEKHVKRVRRQVPPDTGAAIFILKNARPDKWRDRPQADEEIEDQHWNRLRRQRLGTRIRCVGHD